MIHCQSCGEELKNLYEGAQHIMKDCIVETSPQAGELSLTKGVK